MRAVPGGDRCGCKGRCGCTASWEMRALGRGGEGRGAHRALVSGNREAYRDHSYIVSGKFYLILCSFMYSFIYSMNAWLSTYCVSSDLLLTGKLTMTQALPSRSK